MRCLLAVSTLCLVCGPAAGAQSLGEVARQEEARRTAIRGTGTVYTNESLTPDRWIPPTPVVPLLPVVPSASSVPAEPPRETGAAADGSSTPPDGMRRTEVASPALEDSDEAHWRDRMQAARDALARAQLFGEALQSRINGLTADFAARDDPFQRDQVAADRQKALDELERVTREIQVAAAAITGIQEEARKAGVPAGWVR